MDRRQFLRLAGAAIAGGMVLDPDRLLWVPGAKTYFLPDTTIVEASTLEEALRAGLLARVPNGHGGWCDMELVLGGRYGQQLDERVRAEIAAIVAMGGKVVERRTYKAVTL
jgi:hypothetical protein